MALLENTGRELLRVEGDRAARMLNGLISADISNLRPDRGVLTFVLTAKGRPIALPRVVSVGEALYLDVGRAAVGGLLRHLQVFLPPRFARVRPVEGIVRVDLVGPEWRRAVEKCADALDLPGAWRERAAPGSVLRPGAGGRGDGPLLFAVGRDDEDGPGLDLFLKAERAGDATAALRDAVNLAGGATAGSADHEVWRIESGIPLYGTDITEDNLPQETGLVERAVSFDKGCYTGQEVVARIHYRGHVNRLLRGLRSVAPAAAVPPSPGSELSAGGRAAGVVTSSCRSPRFGPIALAYVRRDLGPGDRVTCGPDEASSWIVVTTHFTMA